MRDVCPVCMAPLSHTLTWAGEPVPAGAVTANVTPLHIARINVKCDNGHRFRCTSHVCIVAAGQVVRDQYEGLEWDYGPVLLKEGVRTAG